MPFLILYTIFALLLPVALGAFFEWKFDPAEWAWYTRLALVIIYGYFSWLFLGALDAMKHSYYGTQNRKNKA